HTPIEATAAELTPVRAADPEGLAVIRHSTAHVMADAVQRLFPGTKVTIGPAIDDGFYYDFDKPGGGFTDDDLRKIEQAMLDVVRANSSFRRVVVTRDEAKRMFAAMGETYKVEIIDAIPAGEEVSLYKHGAAPDEWVDVCEGPHVPSTGFLKAVKLTHVGGAASRGSAITGSSAKSSISSCSTRSPRRCRSSCRGARSSTSAWSTTCAASTST